MARLVAVEGKSGLWRWTCLECDCADRRWYRTREEALEAGQVHVDAVHGSDE
jgi:hypothetical protein